MAKLRIEIEMGNAAFADDPGAEVERIIRRVAESMTYSMGSYMNLRDSNGNRCGFAEVVEAQDVAGSANCGCVYHAEEGKPCSHDLGKVVKG